MDLASYRIVARAVNVLPLSWGLSGTHACTRQTQFVSSFLCYFGCLFVVAAVVVFFFSFVLFAVVVGGGGGGGSKWVGGGYGEGVVFPFSPPPPPPIRRCRYSAQHPSPGERMRKNQESKPQFPVAVYA